MNMVNAGQDAVGHKIQVTAGGGGGRFDVVSAQGREQSGGEVVGVCGCLHT